MGDIWEAQAPVSPGPSRDWSDAEQPPLSFANIVKFPLSK